MVFQKPNPFPKSIYENIAYGPRIGGIKQEVRPGRHRRAVPAAGRAVGRGQGPAQGTRPSACPAGSSSGCASPGPSRSTPRSSSWTSPARRSTRSPRRASRTSCASSRAIHDRDRHPQHAAGGPGQRRDRVLLHRGQPGERHPHRPARASNKRPASAWTWCAWHVRGRLDGGWCCLAVSVPSPPLVATMRPCLKSRDRPPPPRARARGRGRSARATLGQPASWRSETGGCSTISIMPWPARNPASRAFPASSVS